jgi:hypothetical protein
MSVLSVAAGALAIVASMAAPSHAVIVTFGSGANSFNMEFVTIGNPGNAADTGGAPNPAGSVGYTYDIGKFEVSEDMIDKFNASQSLQIIKGSTRGPNMPAAGISWNVSARFVNWLNTSTGYQPAYNFTTSGYYDDLTVWTAADTADYDPSNPYRSKRTKYVLPSIDEWYKAAFYDPNKSGGAGYWLYPTGSDTPPTPVSSGTLAGTAVYQQQNPAEVNKTGGLSPYGVMGLGGNANEWQEESYDLANRNGSDARIFRGGFFLTDNAVPGYLSSRAYRVRGPNDTLFNGLRVVMLSPDSPAVVPEPSMMVIGSLFGLGGLIARRRLKK